MSSLLACPWEFSWQPPIIQLEKDQSWIGNYHHTTQLTMITWSYTSYLFLNVFTVLFYFSFVSFKLYQWISEEKHILPQEIIKFWNSILMKLLTSWYHWNLPSLKYLFWGFKSVDSYPKICSLSEKYLKAQANWAI